MKRSASPTRLEQLIADHVDHATHIALTQTVELTAEQLAREILADHAFRARMRVLIERAFGQTLHALSRPARPPRKRPRPRRRR